MKFARLLVAVFVVVMGFTACSSPTGPSYPRIVILEPRDQAEAQNRLNGHHSVGMPELRDGAGLAWLR